jgi:DNA repair exonuclease SbcCD ATPase subunit
MGMGIFDQLYTLAHEEISDISAILKDFRKTDYDVDLADIEKTDTQYKLVQKDLRSQKRTLTTRKRELTDQTLNLTKRLRPVDESIVDIEKLSSDKTEYESLLESMDIRLGSVGATQEENKSKIVELKHRIKEYVDKDTNKKYLELMNLEDDKKELRIEIDKLKIDVRNKLDKIEKLGNLEWDEDCDYCMSNPFTLDAIATNEKLDEDKKLAGEYVSNLDYLDLQIEDMGNIHDNKVDYDRSMEALKTIDISQNKLESEEVLLKERKKNTLHQITVTEERIEKYHESKNDIVYNKQVEEEIDNLKNSVDDLDYQVETIDNKIQTIHGEIQINRTKKKTIMETMNKVEDLETKYEAYEYYMDAVKRDGVPYELIEKALPTIEGEVNDILAQMVDFGIVLEMDGKNINTYLAYDEDNVWPLELSSGMERFISSLAMRVGLINVCNLPRANFLAIDEGFGNMDSDNLNSVYMLFQYLKSQFQFAFIVSHIESMRDTVDSLLEITKTGGFSNITLPSKFS